MFLAYPQNVYSLGHRYTRPEPEDVYGSRSYRHYPTVTDLDYQRTEAHAARAQYLNALEQARHAELEYLESIHRPHSSHLPYGDAYTISSSPSYTSYYDREAAALGRERALNAQLVERRLAQLARQQEEERLRRALEERHRAAAVAQELRRAQEAAVEERRRLEEIRARNERLKKEVLERRRQQQQLLKQSLALKSAPPCSAAFGCPVPTSSGVVPIVDAFNYLFDVLPPVVTGQDSTSRVAVPAPVAPSPPAPATQQKKELKPESKSQPQTGTTSQPPYPQQSLLDLFGLKDDSEIKQVVDNVFGLFDLSTTRPAQSSSSPTTAPSSGSSSSASETKQVPKAQPSAQETLGQRLGAEQDIDFRHVIENVLGLFNPDFVRPTSSTTPRPTTPPRPASSSSDKGKAKEIIPSTEPREPTSKDVLDSFNTIENIAASFSALEHDFEFPSQLDFTDASAQSVLQQLTFTARNAPLRFYEQSLTGLLGQLDAVESYGNEEVRHRRKEVVERIEKALEEIEREVEHRARAWRVKRNPVTTVEDVAPSQNATAKEAASSSAGSSSAAPQEPSSNSSAAESKDAVAKLDVIQGTSSATASGLPDLLEAVTATDSAEEIALATKEEQLLTPEEPSATPSAELEQPSTSQPEPKEPTQSIIVDDSQSTQTHELTEELLSQADPVSESVSTITASSPAPTFAQLAPTHVLTDIAIESSSEETPTSSPAVVPEHKSESTSLGEAPFTSSLPDTTVASDTESEQDSFLLAAPMSESSSLASSKRRSPSVTIEEVPDSDWSEVDA